MVFNETAAAYGVFQVIFAELHGCLAAATWHLRKRTDPNLRFSKVHRQRLSQTLEQFKKESRSDASKETYQELMSVCTRIQELAEFRNERVHARVVRTQEGLALYVPLRHNPDKGERLEMSKDLFEQRIQDATKAMIEFQLQSQKLNAEIRFNEEFDRLMASL